MAIIKNKVVIASDNVKLQTIDNLEDNFYYAFKNGSNYYYTKSKAVGTTACYQFTYTDNVLTKIENIGNITIYLNANTIPEFTIGTTKYTLDETKNDYYIIDSKQVIPNAKAATQDLTDNDIKRIFEGFYETPQNNDWKYVGILGGSVGSTLTVNDDWSELLFVARLQENSAFYNDGKIIPKVVFTAGSPTNNNVFVGFYWNDNYTYKSRIGLYGSGNNRYLKNDYPRSDMWSITGFYIYKR